MRRIQLKWALVWMVLGAGSMAGAQQYAARITLNSERSWVSKKVVVKGNYLVSESGKATIPVDSVKSIEFRFTRLSPVMCAKYFRERELKTMLSLIEQNVGPVLKYSYLPSNLGDFLVWRLRGQFWTHDYEGALKTVELIRALPNSDLPHLADLYKVMALLETDRIADAEVLLAQLKASSLSELPPAMVAYADARLAFAREEYRATLLQVAQLLAFYAEDAEWLPAATALEAEVYLKTDRVELAICVADELIMAYPGSSWSELGEKIKKETNR